MPAKVKVRILAGRNLPVMDKSSDASDAFVEVKLGNTTYKTEVYRRSLNPFWNSEWFRFEVSDQELQDEPLQIRIMDYDTYSANDAIGKVYINLNPLLVNPGRSMSGWLPIYDTLHGIRGEVNCMVKVNLFTDNNRYRNSSCGVRFFFSDIPNGYKCDAILGFVDELLVNDDPEYQWIDKIRTPRASNEARQTLFTKLSGEVQRKLGLKAEIFGGNAVIGYRQSFDLEGGSGIVGRGIGTAVVLSKVGFPYDGIISPLHLGNQHGPPYPLGTSRLLDYHIDRSTSHSMLLHKKVHPERALVHSVSADYFYEVPNATKRLSATLSPPKLTSANLNSDDSDYEDCAEELTFNNDYVTEYDSDDSPTRPTSGVSPPKFSLSHYKIKRLSQINKSLNPLSPSCEAKASRARTPERRLSASSILSKLIQSNELMSKKLVRAVKPITNTNLTKLLSSRKQNQLPSSSGSGATSRIVIDSQVETNTARQPDITLTSSISEESNKSSKQSASANSSGSQKRRRDKSQATSTDDTLSIIEEKLDDDDGHNSGHNPSGTRQRHLSESSRNRQLLRTKEIDLNNDSETSSLTRGASEEETEDNLDSTLNSPASCDVRSQLLSSSSTSILTDETVKAAKLLESKSKISSQLSMPAIRKRTEETLPVRRCDSDLVQAPSVENQLSTNGPSTSQSLARSESIQIGASKCANLNLTKQVSNFAQSVRVVKAQQHLLQNMIRHQNQNLLISSTKRARNAFMYPNRVHESEYPFVTLKKYPDNMIQCTGGVVSVHSVKLLDHIINDEESETRDIWWTEIRKEIRSHAKALNCNTILGYSETSKVLGDVCVLSAFGTAAVLDPSNSQSTSSEIGSYPSSGHQQTLKIPRLSTSPPPSHSSMPLHSGELSGQEGAQDETTEQIDQVNSQSKSNTSGERKATIDCSFCHTPLACVDSIESLASCAICKSSKVPDVLLLTIEPPKNLNIVSSCSLVQARVCRAKRDSHGEASAKEIGDALPFLEYELHKQLFSKLKFKGMNCVYNFEVDISVGENMLTGIATGTGCFVLGLPTPEPPRISAGKGIKTSKLNEIQRLIALTAMKNRESLGLNQITSQLALYHSEHSPGEIHSEYEGGSKEKHSLDNISVISQSNVDYDTSTSVANSDQPSNKIFSLEGEESDNYRRLHQYNQNNNDHHHHHHHHHHHRYHHHKHHRRHKHHHRSKSANFSQPPIESLAVENLLVDDTNNIVLEVDDNEDADIIALLIDSDTPDGYLICNSESMPTVDQSQITSINMFTQTLFVKLRRSLPCCLTNISFVVDLPESQIVQISVTGCLLGLNKSPILAFASDATHELVDPANTTVDKNSDPQNNLASEPSGAVKSSQLTTTSTSSMLPDSISSSSASSTSTPTSSSSSSSTSQSLSSSVKSVKTIPVLRPAKSLTKKLSNSNIAALLHVRSSSNVAGKDENVELTERKPEESTKATIAAVKQEIQQNRLGTSGGQPNRGQLTTATLAVNIATRTVFKKQQTYPGAISPAISGQDRLLPTNQTAAYESETTATPTNHQASMSSSTSGPANSAARKATQILNKVKQPLRDLGSSFNTSIAGGFAADSYGSTTVAQTSVGGSSSTTTTNSRSKSQTKNRLQLHSAQVGYSKETDKMSTGRMTTFSKSKTTYAQANLAVEPVGMMSNSSIDISSLSYIPGAKEYHYLGNLSFSFVRETNSVRENGGLNGFIHCFLMEVYAIVRAHVSALGGNAFLSFRLQQSCIFYHSNKNQAQCLISVAGDAVQVVL